MGSGVRFTLAELLAFRRAMLNNTATTDAYDYMLTIGILVQWGVCV
ncbi:MAG: hypothetical protein LBT88_08030 [Oscillospiraceae bacterium]|nr:hypothetical protein [Oscillospiraceae bacterium]